MNTISDYPAYYHYWGKAQPNQQYHHNQQSPYHLLVYHCLDVAAIAYHLLHDDLPITKDLSAYLEIEPSKLRLLLCFFIALHDLGKFASSFQGLFQPIDDDFLVKVNCHKYAYDKKHDALGYCFYRNALLNNYFGNFDNLNNLDRKTKRQLKSSLTILFNCVLGHHGKPIQTQDKPVNPKEPTAVGIKYQNEIDPKDLQAANHWIKDLVTLFNIQLPIPLLTNDDWQCRAKHISWQLSGLTMLADWLGSDSDYFRYQSKPMPLADYWQMALQIAQRCISDKGLAKIHTPLPFISVQTSFGFSPSPLQAWAQNVPLLPLPQLFILEDVTGSGKTEAALTLVHRLMQMGEADGFYFGLPTTATSNAMFDRITEFMPTLYDYEKSSDGHMPSLVLAHGSKNMNDTFQKLIDNSKHQQVDSTGDEISNQCHAWFASSNKRALLANVGVGTIDQALLAVLPKKHQPLRLLGLHHKILIFDEIHSADSYMFELLKSLLSIHLHQGGHAILLTATLSLDKREQLAQLWLDSQQSSDTQTLIARKTHSKHFPLATQVIAQAEKPSNNVIETAIDSPNRVTRNLKVDFIHETNAVIDYLLQASENGQCSVWIRNTVSDAINAFEDLLAAGVAKKNLILFHSRFTLKDRKHIESQVLASFGKDSSPTTRAGKILIATQVFQESLDADADIMVSDLCPIDYLIQRAGRLHRHQRDELGNRLTDEQQAVSTNSKIKTRTTPLLMILAPKFTQTPDANWYSELFPKSQYVYRHVGQLWLSMRILIQQGCLNLPCDARLLIESVYSNDAQQLIPDALQADSKADMSHQNCKKHTAQDTLIDWQYGYSEQSQTRWFADDSSINSETNTRFQEMPTCEVVLLKTCPSSDLDETQLIFYADTDKFALELSTIKISETLANKLAKLPDKQKQELKARYRALKYKQLWLPSMDKQFIYDSVKGLVQLS